MDYRTPRRTVHTGPEAQGAARLIRFMRAHRWHCEKLSGGLYQVGLPDYVCWHPEHGQRWIETKAPGGKLRRSQEIKFAIMESFGQKIYVLEDERGYPLLFKDKDNWRHYIR